MKVPGCEESMISSLFVEIDDIAQLRALLLNSILNIFADFLVQSNRTIALLKMVQLMAPELEHHIFQIWHAFGLIACASAPLPSVRSKQP